MTRLEIRPDAIRNKLSLLIGAALVILLLVSCTNEAEADTTVILDWFPNSNHTGFYSAIANGYFEDENLEVKIVPPVDPNAIIPSVATGQFDFGISYAPNILQARSEGVEVVSVLAVVQHPLVSVMALPDSGIDTVAELAGKKVGYPGIRAQLDMLSTMLQSTGLTLDDVEVSDVGFNLVQTLLSGEVDAILGAYHSHESIVIEMEGGVFPNILRVEEYGVPDFYELLLITNQELIENEPDKVRRFVSAVRRGFEYAGGNSQRSIDDLIQNADEGTVNELVEREGVELLVPLWTDEGTVQFGAQLQARWEATANWMKQNELIDAELNVNTVFTNQFLSN